MPLAYAIAVLYCRIMDRAGKEDCGGKYIINEGLIDNYVIILNGLLKVNGKGGWNRGFSLEMEWGN